MTAAMFFLVGAFIASANGWTALRSLRRRTPREEGSPPSTIPLAGGLLMVLGMLSAPVTSLHTFAWVPLFLDYGCLPTIGRGLALSLFGRPQRTELTTLGANATMPPPSIDTTADTAQVAQSTLPDGHGNGDGASTSG